MLSIKYCLILFIFNNAYLTICINIYSRNDFYKFFLLFYTVKFPKPGFKSFAFYETALDVGFAF